jgi:hypothetical protein
VAFDVEVYPDRWLVGFHGPGREGRITTYVVDGDAAQLANTLQQLADGGRILVGYNSARYDVPILRAILAGVDPFPVSQAIISKVPPPPLKRGTPDVRCDHVDLAARLSRGGGFPSLKSVAANLGRPVLRELPLPDSKSLSDREWGEVKAYNEVDLGHTWALLEWLAPEIQAVATLSAQIGRDLRSTPNPQVGEAVFLAAYRRERGVDPPRPGRPREVRYLPVEGVVRPQTAEAAEWYDRILEPMPMVESGGRARPDVPHAKFSVAGLTLSVGAGGLHSIDPPMVYYADRRSLLVSADVASFYPSLIATKGINPAAYGETVAATYRALLERRLAAKEAARTVAEPAERERLDVLDKALKLVLNSTYGKFGDPYSTLYDPAAMLAVTLSGQLVIIDLIERLAAAGVRVLSVNTDGLFLHVPRKGRRWREVLEHWERDTGMRLDLERLSRLAIVATNNYATIDRRGKIKRRGDKLKGSLSPVSSCNSLVVNDAIAEALLRDVPPERTVRACDDPVRFCRVTRPADKATAAVLIDDQAKTEEPLPRVTRWYKAKESPRHIVCRFEDGRRTTPPGAVGIALALDLAGGVLPADLDRSWYIAEARRVIQKVGGYRHLSPRRLDGHPLASEALNAGLIPCPKWNGKAVLPGADAAAPTYLWDWSATRTAGTYTGPAVGILVLDIDEPSLFRRWVDKTNAPLVANRWDDLRGCLVSVRGDTTAEDVRAGCGRGKLIFRLAGAPDHPLARVAIARWKKDRGVEVFYGKGIPSIIGEHSSGELYRLDGALGDAPTWLVGGLTPVSRGTGSGRTPSRKNKPRGAPLLDSQPSDELDRLQEDLSRLAPELGSVHWRRKDHDGRVILVGRCPFDHDSGRNEDADLSAGFHGEEPYIHCLHGSCARIREINNRLQGETRTPDAPADSALWRRRAAAQDDGMTATGRQGATYAAQRSARTQADDGDEAPIVLREWPTDLAAAAFHGLAGEIVRAIEPETEADPAALLVQLLVAFGSVVGRNAYVGVGSARHYTNEFVLLVGETSSARKGTSWSEVRQFLAAVDVDWKDKRILGGLSSGEGLIYAVRDPIAAKEPIMDKQKKITGYQDVIKDHGVEDKRLLVIEPEFGGVLKVLSREGNKLSAVIRQAWDANGVLATMTKGTPYRATDAHVSIIGHITANELTMLLTQCDQANGFANRLLWVCCRRSKFLPFGGCVPQDEADRLRQRLTKAVEFARTVERIEWTRPAEDLWSDAYPRLTRSRPGALGVVSNRAEAHSIRLALVYALLDRSDLLKPEHLEAALAVWDYAERSAAYIFGDSTGDRDADRILEALRSAPEGMTRNEIRRGIFGGNKPAETIAAALERLLRLRLARRESIETGGRPAERWFAVGDPRPDALNALNALNAESRPLSTDPYGVNGVNGVKASAEDVVPDVEPAPWSEEGSWTA